MAALPPGSACAFALSNAGAIAMRAAFAAACAEIFEIDRYFGAVPGHPCARVVLARKSQLTVIANRYLFHALFAHSLARRLLLSGQNGGMHVSRALPAKARQHRSKYEFTG